MEHENKSKIQFNIVRVLFPKTQKLNVGDYSIISCELVKTIEGKEICINEIYGTFALISYTPVLFDKCETYTGYVEEVDTKYGVSYNLIGLEVDHKELSEKNKRAFLESVFTPLQLDSLYNSYNDPYDLIEKKDVDKLLQVKGIGKKTINNIFKKFDNNRKYQELLIGLQEFHLTKSIMDKLLATFLNAETVVKKVRENPYILASSVNGIGFLKADKIALSSGMPIDSIERLEAFMEFYLYQRGEEGNSWVAPNDLFKAIPDILGTVFSDDKVRKALYDLNERDILVWNDTKTRIGLKYYYDLETKIQVELSRLMNAPNYTYIRDKEYEKKIVNQCEKEIGFELDEEKIKAVNNILENHVSLLVGGGGVGKTLTVRLIASMFHHKDKSICLCTLSGKAAARIYEATGYNGSTIHRALRYNPATEGFEFNENNKMPYSLVVVDETSFVGGELFLSLLKAIPTGATVVFVGDDKQLPAIGACNVFFDMINSHKVSLNRLTKIHRQAQKSGIITMSKAVREGTQLTKKGWHGVDIRGDLQDFVIDCYEDRIISKPKLMDYYKKMVRSIKDAENTQIILATKTKGDVNTFDINNEIQEYLNPHSRNKAEIQLQRNGKNFIIREGDRVINRKNNYKATIYKENANFSTFMEEEFDDTPEETEIFNGFCGIVKRIIDNKVIVKFDMVDPLIEFSYDTLKNLELSYALTVHLFQGSQVPNVIFLIDNSSYIMNTRELVYTAITRASSKCYLLAQEQALSRAINTSDTINKQTYLKDLLIKNA